MDARLSALIADQSGVALNLVLSQAMCHVCTNFFAQTIERNL